MLIDGVVNEAPVCKAVPPVEAANQESVPAEAVAANVTVPVPQRLPGVVPVIVGAALTVATTAVLAEVHPPLVTCT